MKRPATDEDFAVCIAEAERELTPAGKKDAARMVDMVAAALQVNTPNELGSQVYVRILGELPLDLLHEATKRVLETHTFAKLPTPGEWVQAVKDEMAARRADIYALKHLQGKLQLAEKYYPPAKGAPMSEAERRRMDHHVKSIVGKVAPSNRK